LKRLGRRVEFGEGAISPHATFNCVDSSYHELRGSAAAAQGCPTTTAGSRSFRRENPALFSASGFAEHPYEEVSPPNKPTYLCGTKLCAGRSDPDFADLPELPRLARTLDRLGGVYGSHSHFPVWNTEYGFRTVPPDPHIGIDPTTAADYLGRRGELLPLSSQLGFRSFEVVAVAVRDGDAGRRAPVRGVASRPLAPVPLNRAVVCGRAWIAGRGVDRAAILRARRSCAGGRR
jgi:hypothetical protein